ncbi:ketopantoate reductase family protein [Tropicimonas marinistellae]|uniref:ketopantoate reductase family protein n=1 Tax=Tropicimonas marinistellae TaxID=1739787 RepID=UPI0013737CA5|nr:2-dehydropantoate 2-reductase [Tropicimonas marinistellae]
MRFLIMGAGALGSYFGARLVAAGHAVAFVARGAHLDAMRTRGLSIRSPLGDLDLDRVRAFADPAEAGAADAVLFMVKNYDVSRAGAQLSSVLAEDAVVITAQNGITAHKRLADLIGPRRVAPGMVYMPADIPEPGVVGHYSDFSRLVIGPVMDGNAAVLEPVAAALRGAGIDVEQVEDADAALWEKFVLLASIAALTCLTRLDLGPIRACPETQHLLRAALDEAMAVGKAVCPGLTDTAADRAWSLLQSMRPDVHASMLDDLQRGKRLELDYVSGEIQRLGRAHGIATPVHGFANDLLRPFVDGAPG